MNNRLDMQLFGGQQRKSFTQIHAHLIAKSTDGTSAGAIAFANSVFKYMSE